MTKGKIGCFSLSGLILYAFSPRPSLDKSTVASSVCLDLLLPPNDTDNFSAISYDFMDNRI